MTTSLPFPPHITPPPRTARDVREIRSRLGLTQAQFGAVLGLHRSTIIRYEAGSKIGLLEQWALEGLAQRVATLEAELPALIRRPLARATPFAL